MSDEAGDLLADREAQIVRLQHEIDANRVSRISGVPIEFLSGATESELFTSAQAALAWKAEGAEPDSPPAPRTSAVPASTITSADRIAMSAGQITSRDALARLSPQERLRAWRDGRLQQLGVNPPGPTRIGISGSPMMGG
jgi:hypothetical protein